MGTLFLLLTFHSCPTFSKEPLQIHLYDTGFCPSLIKAPEGVVIKPVVDVTQKNTYSCEKSNLNSLRFHGHWVLTEMLSNITKTEVSIEITPIIIFDKQGKQSLSFWKRALEYSKEKKATTILAAAGYPLPSKKEMKKSGEIQIPDIPLFLSAGRKGKSLLKETLLFPQVHENKENVFIIGSYYPGIEGAKNHFSDPQLMAQKTIDYFFPFKGENSPYKDLKGTSYSLSQMGQFLMKNCLQKHLRSCLKAHESPLELKNGKNLEKVKTLK